MAFLSPAVRQFRYEQLDRIMESEKLDAVIIFGEAMFQFFTNFRTDVRVWERPIALVFSGNNAPLAILNALSAPHIENAAARGRLWVDDIRIYYEFPGKASNGRGADPFLDHFSGVIDALDLPTGRIGVDQRPDFLAAISELHANIEFRRAGPIDEIRRVKHPEELALMERLCGMTHQLQTFYRENIRPGRLLRELDCVVTAHAHELAAELFPDEDFNIRVCTYSGRDSVCPSGSAGDAGYRISTGESLVNYIIPTLNGVQVEDERTYFCGQPDDEQRRAYDAALAANRAGIEQLVAGNPICAFDRAARLTLVDRGFGDFVLHRTGHGMGIDNHEYPIDTGFNEGPLLENEVYSCEPGIYVPGLGGFRIDDTVVVGADAPRVLTTSPRELDSQIVI